MKSEHRRNIPNAPNGSPTAACRSRSAFSLVELVIVVVIIGVIAAIAVPRLSQGARGADESALRGSLTAMRNAIDRYAAEHNGTFPGAAMDGQGNGPNTFGAFESQLVKHSNSQGGVSSGGSQSHPFGPYLRAMPPVPVGPNKGEKTIAIDVVNSPPLVTGGPEGWVYNPLTGEVIANTDQPNAEGNRTYDEY